MIILERKCTYTATNRPKVTWQFKTAGGTVLVFKTKTAALEYASMMNAWQDTLENMTVYNSL
jgi:hypothetical protein